MVAQRTAGSVLSQRPFIPQGLQQVAGGRAAHRRTALSQRPFILQGLQQVADGRAAHRRIGVEPAPVYPAGIAASSRWSRSAPPDRYTSRNRDPEGGRSLQQILFVELYLRQIEHFNQLLTEAF